MSKQSFECDESQLVVLLNGDEQSDAFRRSAEHLESCDQCQTRLTTLVADPGTWDDVAESLREDDVVRDSDNTRLDFLAPPSHPELLGRLGRYEIESVIGSGGMGVVLKAHDTELNRPVAIKVLAPHLAHNGAARQRFAREGRAAAAVVHEHVMAIHNVESDADNPFLVMQFVSGQSLQTRLDDGGPMDVKEILRIGAQAASGLAAAHAQGVVHRDVKPSNILLENGVERVVLSDFGLARAVDDASVTRQGTLAGTPEYMSPEQARGEAVDHRSDLFGLGSVLYSMCTGQSPFKAGTTLGVLRKIADETTPSIREINPEIPDWLEAIIDRLLAKDASKRFQTAEEVCELLGQWLAHLQAPETKPRPRTPAVRRAVKPNKKDRQPLLRRRMYWITALSLLFVAIAAAVVMFVRLGETTVRIEIDDPNIAVRFGEEEITFEHDGQKIYVTPGEKNQIVVNQREMEVQRGSFELKKGQKVVLRISIVNGRVDVSGDDGVVWLPSRGTPRNASPLVLLKTLREHASPVYTLAFSPDGNTLVTAGNDLWIKLWDAATGRDKATLKGHTKGVRFVAFSPDGTLLASACADSTIGLWDVATGERKLTLKGHDGPASGVAFSTDGATLASCGDDRTVRLWEIATGKQKAVLEGHNGAVWAVAFSPDGKTLVSGSDDMRTRLWDTATGEQIGGLKVHVGSVRAVAFNSIGSVLATGSLDSTINLWNVAAARKTPGLSPFATFKGHSKPVVSLSFSPDGKTLASGSWDGTIKLWDVASGQERSTIKAHSNLVWSVAFSPHGKILASASRDKTIKLWHVPTSDTIESNEARDAAPTKIKKLGGRVSIDERQILEVNDGLVRSVAISPDSKIVASCGDRFVQLFDLKTGKRLHRLEGHTNPVLSIAFTPDGKQLVSSSVDQTMRIWDVQSGRQLRLLRGRSRSSVLCIAIAGKSIVSCWRGWRGGVRTERHEIGLWNLETGLWEHYQQRGVFPTLDEKLPVHVAFSPNGKQVAISERAGNVRLYELNFGFVERRVLKHDDLHEVTWVAFAPDGGKLLSCGRDNTIRVWDVKSGKPLTKLSGSNEGSDLTAALMIIDLDRERGVADIKKHDDNNDGSLDRDELKATGWLESVLAKADVDRDGTVSRDEAICRWARMRRDELATTRSFQAASFSQDGSRVVSVTRDECIQIWETESGKLLSSAIGTDKAVSALALTADGKTLATCGDDRVIKLWQIKE